MLDHVYYFQHTSFQLYMNVLKQMKHFEIYGRFTFSPILVTAISIKVVPRAKRKSRIQARKAAGNR
jgi:hypothetical protein